ncbi:hypothetical protein EPUS_06189 [Endocarpon pusillum Z07020]|uniref:Uncharacterized protein n=1 Tax=Endocarpon pusillum (strain Z07020 / HMAS-L-300199) TaxID=1263415 RepID=U1I007_ENDPU|nr:uncharacterized protein EPUS_06189 [Endocarpon pusillum Z07020]ERF75149.1 hypothetical protein EPUS_06189 [Endocarpon pusillum Z07020]
MPRSVPVGSDLIASLSLEMVDSPIGRKMKRSELTTSIRGVFGCGDAGTFMKHITQAMAQDALAAVAILQAMHGEGVTAALSECENQDDSPKTSTTAEMELKNAITGVVV